MTFRLFSGWAALSTSFKTHFDLLDHKVLVIKINLHFDDNKSPKNWTLFNGWMFRFSSHRIENDTNLNICKWANGFSIHVRPYRGIFFSFFLLFVEEIAFQHSFHSLSGNGLPYENQLVVLMEIMALWAAWHHFGQL